MKNGKLDVYFSWILDRQSTTHNGAEVDMVLVQGTIPIASVEVKYTNTPVLSKGFYECISDLKTLKNYVITPHSKTWETKEGILVCSLSHFLTKELGRLGLNRKQRKEKKPLVGGQGLFEELLYDHLLDLIIELEEIEAFWQASDIKFVGVFALENKGTRTVCHRVASCHFPELQITRSNWVGM